MYLYHPPFALRSAVDYVSPQASPNDAKFHEAGEEHVEELFMPPPGWGVLRSGAGLLLWLQLSAAMAFSDEVLAGNGHLRVEFGSNLAARAESAGLLSAKAPLLCDEGILRPRSDEALKVRLEEGFDQKVKEWLSIAGSGSNAFSEH